jgi:hypothetical protein
MPLLRDHPDDLDALVAATASSLRLDTGFVEKDFWVIEVLRAATAPIQTTAKDGSQHPVRTIFKGGTSLSRAYGLIERFSEDVDLLVSFPQVDIGIGTRDKVLKAIRDAVARHLATTGVQGAVTADDAWDEFESASVAVLAPERTLLEKLALLHDAASRYPDDNARAKLLIGGRHLYDVHKLLSSDDVIATLSTSQTSAETSTNTARTPTSASPRDQRPATKPARCSIRNPPAETPSARVTQRQ